MLAIRWSVSLVVAAGVGGMLIAAGPQPPQQPAAPPAKAPPKGSAPKDTPKDAPPKEAPPKDGTPAQGTPAWPAAKEKKLYGEDFRGKKAPEIVVEQMLTEKVDREGKVVLIDFWATWCGPCREAIPELNQIQQKFNKDVVVLGISDEPESQVRAFMKKTEMKYAQAIDTQARMKKKLRVTGIPHVIIVSTDGVVRWQGFPLDENDRLTADVVKQIIEADPGVKARREKEKGKKK